MVTPVKLGGSKPATVVIGGKTNWTSPTPVKASYAPAVPSKGYFDVGTVKAVPLSTAAKNVLNKITSVPEGPQSYAIIQGIKAIPAPVAIQVQKVPTAPIPSAIPKSGTFDVSSQIPKVTKSLDYSATIAAKRLEIARTEGDTTGLWYELNTLQAKQDAINAAKIEKTLPDTTGLKQLSTVPVVKATPEVMESIIKEVKSTPQATKVTTKDISKSTEFDFLPDNMPGIYDSGKATIISNAELATYALGGVAAKDILDAIITKVIGRTIPGVIGRLVSKGQIPDEYEPDIEQAVQTGNKELIKETLDKITDKMNTPVILNVLQDEKKEKERQAQQVSVTSVQTRTLISEGRTKLHIMSAKSDSPNIENLRGEQDIRAKTIKGIQEKYEGDTIATEAEFIADKIPSLGLLLLTGKADKERARQLIADYRLAVEGDEQLKDVKTDLIHERIALMIHDAKKAGLDDKDTQALLAAIIKPLNQAQKNDLKSWTQGGWFGTDMASAALLRKDMPVDSSFFRNPDVMLAMTVGTVLTGGVTGFALKGLAGLASGAMLGVFCGTEIYNGVNSSVFVTSQLEKLKQAGIVDPDTTLKGFDNSYKDLSAKHNAALKDGDLANADGYARRIADLSEKYATWINDNWAAFEYAGILDDVRTDATTNYDSAKARFFGGEEEPAHSATVNLKDFDPKQDWIRVNGTTLQGFTGTDLKLPPGEYKVEHGRTGYDTITQKFSIKPDGGYFAPEATTGQPLKVEVDPITGHVTPEGESFTSDKRILEVEKTIALGKGVPIKVEWEKGWQAYDPSKKAWVSSGDIPVYYFGRNTLQFKDAEGNMRYTSINIADPDQPQHIGALDSLPFNPVKYEPTKKGDESLTKLSLVGTPVQGAKYYLDGNRLFDPQADVLVSSGQHAISIELPGYQPKELTIDLQPGEQGRLSLTQPMTELPKEKEPLKGGGGNGSGQQQQQPQAQVQPLIVFGNTLANCKVWLDEVEIAPVIGQAYGTTSGYHSVRATNAKGQTASKNVYCSADAALTVNFSADMWSTDTTPTPTPTPEPTAQAKIIFGATLTGQRIWLDGSEIKPGIGTAYDVAPGYHAIKATNTAGKVANKNVYCSKDQPITINFAESDYQGSDTTPTITTTTIKFGTSLQDCTIMIDDKEITPEINKEYDVKTGSHTIDATKTNGYYAETTVIAYANVPLLIDFVAGDWKMPIPEPASEVYDCSFTSDPEGAKILLGFRENNYVAAFSGEWTPAKIALSRGLYKVNIYKTGYVQTETWLWVDETILQGQPALDKAFVEGWRK